MPEHAWKSLLLAAVLLAPVMAHAQSAAPFPGAEARDALLQAGQATGTESPAEAGASYARPSGPVPPPLPQPPAQAELQIAEPEPVAPQVAPSPEAAAPAPPPVPSPVEAAGAWRIQLGTFSVPGNAEKLWDRLSTRPELSGRARIVVPSGRFTVLYAGGYSTQAAAQAACRSLRQARHDCLVTGG